MLIDYEDLAANLRARAPFGEASVRPTVQRDGRPSDELTREVLVLLSGNGTGSMLSMSVFYEPEVDRMIARVQFEPGIHTHGGLCYTDIELYSKTMNDVAWEALGVVESGLRMLIEGAVDDPQNRMRQLITALLGWHDNFQASDRAPR